MNIQNHPVVSREEWGAARKQHLAHEKAFTKERDKLSAERRALPWVKIDKPYRFQGTNGELSLTDLFGGRSQLIVYHFMFAAGWDEGCPGCSFLSDHIDGANQHRPPRRRRGRGFPRTVRRIPTVQTAHGLEIRLGLVRKLRLQLRLRCLRPGRRRHRRESDLQLRKN